jgi:hypothetical protein
MSKEKWVIMLFWLCTTITAWHMVYAKEPQITQLERLENLVSKLALADLSSEKHEIPGYAIYQFGDWTSFILKDIKRKNWTITTVRKKGQFEFIEAKTDDLIVRQLPEVVMIGFSPKTPEWQVHLADTVRDFLKSNVVGKWDAVKIDSPKKVGDSIFLESAGAFSGDVGTARDSFVAVVVDKKIWVCFLKRLNFGGPADYALTIDSNKRWFSMLPGGR